MQPVSTAAEPPASGMFSRAGSALLLVYVIVYFARPQDLYNFAFPGLLKLVAYPMLVCGFLAVFFERQRPLLDFPQARMIALLVGIMFVSMLFAHLTEPAFNTLRYLMESTFLVLFVASILARHRTRYQTLVRVFAFGMAWLAVEGVRFYVLPGGGRWRGSIGGSFLNDVNDYALFICAGLPLLAYCALTATRRFSRVFWWGATAAGVASVVFTYSRGAMIALVAMGLYAVVRVSGHKVRMATLLATVALVLFLVLPTSYWGLFEGLTPQRGYQDEVEFGDSSANTRYDTWRASVMMARDHPIVGVGAGGFMSAMVRGYHPPGVRHDRPAHSMYFQLLGELGVPGLLWVLGLGWLNLRTCAQTRRRARAADDRDAVLLAYGLEVGFVGFMVGAAFLTVAYYPTIYWLSWFIGMHARLGAPSAAPAPLRPAYGSAYRIAKT